MNTRAIRCMKFFLTLFNIICILFALVVVAVCVMNMRGGGGGGGGGGGAGSAVSRGALAFLLALGLALLAAAALGCIAALREHIKTLYTHACFFMLLVSLEVLVGAGGAAVSAWAGAAPSPLRAGFFRNLTVHDDGGAAHIVYWDKLQAEYSCCGVDGPADYAAILREVPASCCARAGPLRDGPARRHLHAACLQDHSYFQEGCEQALAYRNHIKKNVFISTAIVFALLEIACIVLALWMARAVRRERRKLQQNLQAHFET